MTIRLIPRLDIKGPNVVKGIHLEGLRVLGKPEDFARHYYNEGADELLYVDIVASLYGRNSLLDLVRRTAAEIFIPLCVGGGLRSVDDIRAALRSGADKVTINTAAIQDPELVRRSARMFGSSTIVVAIEVIRDAATGRYECFTDSGREATGLEALEWARKVEDLGAGEILVTSVDREGTGRGFDIELIRSISDAVSIPVIAHGGAGTKEHVMEAATAGRADAIALASVLHYGALAAVSFEESEHGGEGNFEFRKGGGVFSKVEPTSISSLKRGMLNSGIPVRPVE